MISLKRWMQSDGEEALDAYRRTTALLLQSIALHSVEGEAGEYENFRATVTEIIKGISDDTPPAEVLIAAGTASKTLQEYGRRTTKFIKAQGIELQSIINMLTQTMSDVSGASERSISRLQDIERKLAKAAMIDDLRTLKLRMSECLDAVREECTHQKNESSQMVSDLRSVMSNAEEQRSAMLEHQPDPVTGLPARAVAEGELRKASTSSKRIYAGIFIVDRMNAINSRFGHAIGDKVLTFYAQRLTEALSASDRVFKWGDSSFLAIVERQEALDNTRRELGHYLYRKWDRPFELGARSIVLPISATWLLVEASGRSASKAIAEIDGFVARTVPPS
jgi:GGDEF domain-containing protein